MPSAKYAQDTTVPISRSRDEIERVLAKHRAADHINWDQRDDAIALGFRYAGWPIRITVRVPARESYRVVPNSYWRKRSDAQVAQLYTAELRRRYRVLLIQLKSRLEAVDDEDMTAEEAFLPYLLLPSGQTLGGTLAPQLGEILASGAVPELAPAPAPPLALPPAPPDRIVRIREEKAE